MSERETELSRPTAEARPAPPPKPRRELGRAGAVARGTATLAMVALGAWLLSLLGTFESPASLVRDFRDGEGNHVWMIFGPPGTHGSREHVQVVLSRLPGELQPGSADRIHFPRELEGPETKLLPSAPLVLIDHRGRVTTLDRLIPFETLRRLQRHPPADGETLPSWFRKPAVEHELRRAGVDLRSFWE